MSHDPVFERELQSHIETWAAHCGAPKAVYIGHLKVLLQACVEQCARIAESSGSESEITGKEVGYATCYESGPAAIFAAALKVAIGIESAEVQP